MVKIEIPQTRYARNGRVNLAFQVVGDGPIDVLYVPPGINHLDYYWQYPPNVRVFERLAAYSRFVIYDRRGSGLSDRTVEPPTIAEAASDALAILDELGIERVHLVGFHEGGSVALALAAAHPDRVVKVAVYEAFCRVLTAEDFPWGYDRVEFSAMVAAVEDTWGSDDLLRVTSPDIAADDPDAAGWFRRMSQAGASPSGAAAYFRNLADVDIRPIVGAVACPVLVTNRVDSFWNPGQSRYLAERLPNAVHIEYPGADFMPMRDDADTEAFLDEIEEFFTGTRPSHAPTRALATVMFTDIVGSSEQAADLGDKAWRALLARHDERTRQHVEGHDGRVVKSTGDGALATFDDPENAIAAAQDLIADVGDAGLDLRVGIHSGKIEITGDDVAGIAVHLAARISALAGPGDIYVSRTVADLMLGSAVKFDDRGTHDLKGIPGTWDILAVVSD